MSRSLRIATAGLLGAISTIGLVITALLAPHVRLILLLGKRTGVWNRDLWSFLFELILGWQAVLEPIGAVLLSINSVLIGVIIGFLIYTLLSRKLSVKVLPTIGTGSILSILSIGCLSCGTFILGPLLIALGVGSLLTFLPLRGAEIGILAMLLLVFSLYKVIRALYKEPYS